MYSAMTTFKNFAQMYAFLTMQDTPQIKGSQVFE